MDNVPMPIRDVGGAPTKRLESYPKGAEEGVKSSPER